MQPRRRAVRSEPGGELNLIEEVRNADQPS